MAKVKNTRLEAVIFEKLLRRADTEICLSGHMINVRDVLVLLKNKVLIAKLEEHKLVREYSY